MSGTSRRIVDASQRVPGMWAVRAVRGGLVLKDYLSKEEAAEIAALDLSRMPDGGELLVFDEHGNLEFTHRQAGSPIARDKYGRNDQYGLSLLAQYNALPGPPSSSAAATPMAPPAPAPTHQSGPAGPAADPPDRPLTLPLAKAPSQSGADTRPSVPAETCTALFTPSRSTYLSHQHATPRSILGLVAAIGLTAVAGGAIAGFAMWFVADVAGACQSGTVTSEALCNWVRSSLPSNVAKVSGWIIGGILGFFIWVALGDKNSGRGDTW